MNSYSEMEKVATEVVLPLWEDVLYKKGWVSEPTLEGLRSSVLVKYSPIKELTNEQQDLVDEIANDTDTSYVINGDAGTGKTVLLTNIVASVLRNRKSDRIAVVVQPNWEKTAKEIFIVYGMNSSNLVIATSTELIGMQEEFDMILVDESHKMSRKGNK